MPRHQYLDCYVSVLGRCKFIYSSFQWATAGLDSRVPKPEASTCGMRAGAQAKQCLLVVKLSGQDGKHPLCIAARHSCVPNRPPCLCSYCRLARGSLAPTPAVQLQAVSASTEAAANAVDAAATAGTQVVQKSGELQLRRARLTQMGRRSSDLLD